MPTPISTNTKFVEAIKHVENNYALAKRSGEYKQTNGNGEWRWFPGKSPEGGTPTLAWGHKLTESEWAAKKVSFIDPKIKEPVARDFRYGLTDEEAHALLIKDIDEHEEQARRDWNRYQEKPTYDELPEKYKMVLVNLVYNAGLVKKGKWIWNTAAAGIKAGDDKKVASGMVTSYKTPGGVWRKLTSRAIDMAKVIGLPYDHLEEK